MCEGKSITEMAIEMVQQLPQGSTFSLNVELPNEETVELEYDGQDIHLTRSLKLAGSVETVTLDIKVDE